MATNRISPIAPLARNVTPEYLMEIGAAGTNGVPVARGGVPLKRQRFSVEVDVGAFTASSAWPYAHGVWDSDSRTYSWSAASESISATCDGWNFTTPLVCSYNGGDKGNMRNLSDGGWISSYDGFGDVLDDPGGLYGYLSIGGPLSPWLGVRRAVGRAEPPSGFPAGRWAMSFTLALEPTPSPSGFHERACPFWARGLGWLSSDAAFRRFRRDGRTFSPWRLADTADVETFQAGSLTPQEIEDMGSVYDTCIANMRSAWLSVAANISVTLRVVDSEDLNLSSLAPG